MLLEFTGNGSDLFGRRQPRKEFANEDFPVPEAPKTTSCVKKIAERNGDWLPFEEKRMEGQINQGEILFVSMFSKSCGDFGFDFWK